MEERPSVDESDETEKKLIFHLGEPTKFAGHFHQMIKLALSIDDDDDDEDLGDDDDLLLPKCREPRTRHPRWRQSTESGAYCPWRWTRLVRSDF